MGVFSEADYEKIASDNIRIEALIDAEREAKVAEVARASSVITRAFSAFETVAREFPQVAISAGIQPQCFGIVKRHFWSPSETPPLFSLNLKDGATKYLCVDQTGKVFYLDGNSGIHPERRSINYLSRLNVSSALDGIRLFENSGYYWYYKDSSFKALMLETGFHYENESSQPLSRFRAEEGYSLIEPRSENEMLDYVKKFFLSSPYIGRW